MSFIALIIFTILAIISRRGTALVILIATMIIWPEYVRFNLGITQMSISRIVAVILLIRFWKSARLEVNKYDKVIFYIWVVSIVMQTIAGASSTELIRTIGRIMDTVFMYYATRVCLVNLDEFKRFVSGLKYVFIPATILGLRESATATSIYTSLRFSNSWAWFSFGYEARLGSWVRGFGASLHPIYWGMSMLVVFLLQAITSRIVKPNLLTLTLIIAAIGVFTSLSSGPMGSVVTFLALALLIRTKKHFQLFLRVFLVGAIAVEIISDRHFYDMIQYFAMNGNTAWYRSQLLKVAITNYKEYYLFGAGGVWPHHWGAQVDGRRIVDIVNQYIMIALYGGISLLVLFLYAIFKPMVNFYKDWTEERTNLNEARRLFLFALIAVFLSGFTVAFYNPYELLVYILFGVGRQLEVLHRKQLKSG